MRKSMEIVVKPVGKLFSLCGGFMALFSAVKNTGITGVYKKEGLYKFIHGFILTFFHLFFSLFLSVIRSFIPTIHTTYNKLQLININNFVFSNRRYK